MSMLFRIVNNPRFFRPHDAIIDYFTIGYKHSRQFRATFKYYASLFHEYTHATGHEKRLNRHATEQTNFDFGSKDYSREELVAELGSAFLCASAQIDNS